VVLVVEVVIDVILEQQETHLLLVRLKVILVVIHLLLQVHQLGVKEVVVEQVLQVEMELQQRVELEE
tara:strand:+ start:151 stop:351 length:201 start_codon:yes stop_codon:yes gene_type:complete